MKYLKCLPIPKRKKGNFILKFVQREFCIKFWIIVYFQAEEVKFHQLLFPQQNSFIIISSRYYIFLPVF